MNARIAKTPAKDSSADTRHDWTVICLCAQWCSVCREWRAAFEQAAASHPDIRFAWVDVEDEADAMGDVDIETFPTLLVAQAQTPRFFGPVLPSAAQVTRLLGSLRAAPAALADAGEARALLLRLTPVLLLIR